MREPALLPGSQGCPSEDYTLAQAWKSLERPEEEGPGCPCPERAVGAVREAAIQGQAPRTLGISLVARPDRDAVGVPACERPRTLSRGPRSRGRGEGVGFSRSKRGPQPLIRKQAPSLEADRSLGLAGLGAWGEWSEAPAGGLFA